MPDGELSFSRLRSHVCIFVFVSWLDFVYAKRNERMSVLNAYGYSLIGNANEKN